MAQKILVTGSAGLIGSESVKFFCSKGFDVYGIDNDNGQQALTSISPSGGTDWLVVKLNFQRRLQSLYVNPTSGVDGPVVPDATLTMPFSSFSQIRIGEGYNNTTNLFDEVRIGTTFHDVRRGQ